MREAEQLMNKVRLRRLLEEILDADLVQLDLEEDTESPGDISRPPQKRVSLVVRYVRA